MGSGGCAAGPDLEHVAKWGNVTRDRFVPNGAPLCGRLCNRSHRSRVGSWPRQLRIELAYRLRRVVVDPEQGARPGGREVIRRLVDRCLCLVDRVTRTEG